MDEPTASQDIKIESDTSTSVSFSYLEDGPIDIQVPVYLDEFSYIMPDISSQAILSNPALKDEELGPWDVMRYLLVILQLTYVLMQFFLVIHR